MAEAEPDSAVDRPARSEGRLSSLGVVSLVQVQPDGLIVGGSSTGPAGSIYDPSRRVVVDQLHISPRGVEATLPDGEHVLDIHHLDHPGKEYDDDDLVCGGFSAHYDAMRTEFGQHMTDGIAGENIVVEWAEEVWPEDLGETLLIENQETGEVTVLEFVTFTSPCVEFSRFCARQTPDEESARRLGEILRFLKRGRRGFLFVLDQGHEMVTVRAGDRVFL